MARPSTITNEQILDAARAVFLEKGIRATTAEVARRAGVAEGSIFNRFRTKEDLFCAAMHLGQAGEPDWFRDLVRLAEASDVKECLVEIGTRLVGFFRHLMPLMMMAWSNAGTIPNTLKEPNPMPMRGLKAITSFFEAHMRAGRLARQDPEILARNFLGSIQNYVFFEILLQAHDQLPLPEATFLRGLVQLLWRGIRPAESPGEDTVEGRAPRARRRVAPAAPGAPTPRRGSRVPAAPDRRKAKGSRTRRRTDPSESAGRTRRKAPEPPRPEAGARGTGRVGVSPRDERPGRRRNGGPPARRPRGEPE